MNNEGMVSVEAVASNSNGTTADSLPLTFTIILTKPSAPGNFKLALNDDTGIIGDNITAVREPDFIGTTVPNATVELFQVGSSTIWDTATADANGNFSVQLPFDLTVGQISLYVEVVDLAGNTSPPSSTLTLTIVSVASDYNGDGYSDPALRTQHNDQSRAMVRSSDHAACRYNSLDLVHQRYRIRPGRRRSLPGRLRWRRQGRPCVLPAKHCDLVYAGFQNRRDLVIRLGNCKFKRPSRGLLRSQRPGRNGGVHHAMVRECGPSPAESLLVL